MTSHFEILEPSIRRIFIIVPHFNEDPETVKEIVTGLSDLSAQIPSSQIVVLYVDDGSAIPLTVQISENAVHSNLSIRTIRVQENQGPGFAFQRGFQELPEDINSNDFIILMEGDNTSNPRDITSMLWIANNPFSKVHAVIASPYSLGGGFSGVRLHRIIISKIANFLVKRSLGLEGVHTLGNFFRLINGAAIKELQNSFGPTIVHSRGFESMVELLWKISNKNFRVIEFPTLVSHEERRGKSKMKIIKTSIAYLSLIRRLRRISG